MSLSSRVAVALALPCEACGFGTFRALCHFCRTTAELIQERRCVSCGADIEEGDSLRIEGKCSECISRHVRLSRATRWLLRRSRIIDKALDGRRMVSPETERPAQWGEPTPDRIALVVLTTDPVHTGYQSRKSQARHFCRTGASPVRASRERAADPLPRTHENPRPVGLGDESGLSDARHAVMTDLGALSLP